MHEICQYAGGLNCRRCPQVQTPARRGQAVVDVQGRERPDVFFFLVPGRPPGYGPQ